MFNKIKQLISDNRPVRNGKLKAATKELKAWESFAHVLHKYLGENVVEVCKNGYLTGQTLTDILVIVESDAQVGSLTLYGDSKIILWPNAKRTVIGEILQSKSPDIGINIKTN